MNNIFDPNYSNEITSRIKQLNSDSQPKWGKMNVAQMLAHCSTFQEIAMGNASSPRSLLGILIGKFVKPMFYNDKPLPKNLSTIPTLVIADQREFETERETLIEKIMRFQSNGPAKCTKKPHPFFGRLSPEEWGKGIYKHLDHHLKQFGV